METADLKLVFAGGYIKELACGARVRLPAVPMLSSDLRQIVHTRCASVTTHHAVYFGTGSKSATGKVTVYRYRTLGSRADQAYRQSAHR